MMIKLEFVMGWRPKRMKINCGMFNHLSCFNMVIVSVWGADETVDGADVLWLWLFSLTIYAHPKHTHDGIGVLLHTKAKHTNISWLRLSAAIYFVCWRAVWARLQLFDCWLLAEMRLFGNDGIGIVAQMSGQFIQLLEKDVFTIHIYRKKRILENGRMFK